MSDFEVIKYEPMMREADLDLIKAFCIDALSLSVRTNQIQRDKAADMLVEWFPGDRFVLAGLYKHTRE